MKKGSGEEDLKEKPITIRKKLFICGPRKTEGRVKDITHLTADIRAAESTKTTEEHSGKNNCLGSTGGQLKRRLIDANDVCARCRMKNCGCCVIEASPTVDAVEVVRCSQCKHYQQYHMGKTEELCEWGKCKLISMDVDMPESGYCCFGERREGE